MKKLLQALPLLLSSFTICTEVLAQPTLTATNFNPVIGNQYIHKECNYLAPGQAGANRTWNFAAAVATANTVTNDYLARNAAPNPTMFPNANIVARAKVNGTISSYSYSQVSAAGSKSYGVSNSQNVMQSYSNPIEISMPISYNGIKTDTYKATYTTNNQPWTKTGTMTIKYDGYGTVITPKGTFFNCIRLKINDTQKDSTNFGGALPYVVNSTSETYAFYLAGTHEPIFRVGTLTSLNGTQNFGMYMNSLTTTAATEDFANEISLHLYPNPATAAATVEFNFNEPGEVKVSLTNLVGLEIKVLSSGKMTTMIQKHEFSVADLPKGIYFVRIAATDKNATRRLVVQ